MVIGTENESVLAFAFTHDKAYPLNHNYTYHIHGLHSPTQNEVLALYSFMHLIDDIADNRDDTKNMRSDNVARFVRGARDYILSAHRADQRLPFETPYLGGDALAWLLETVRDLSLAGKLEISAISRLAAAVNQPNRWPDRPHLASMTDFDRYNETLFAAVAGCLHLSIFSRCADGGGPRYRDAFKDFMKGMQVINLLMDLEEDAQAGHYLLPRDFYSGPEFSRITRDAYGVLLDYADESFARSGFLLTDDGIPEDVRSFFHGLRGIYSSLSHHVDVLRRVDG